MSTPLVEWLAICDAPRGGVCARRALGKTKCGATVNDGPAKGEEAEPEILGPACGKGDRILMAGGAAGALEGPAEALTGDKAVGELIKLDIDTAGC